jgi:hypothetical protein
MALSVHPAEWPKAPGVIGKTRGTVMISGKMPRIANSNV